ncbi:MAG: site-specific integrase [Candidatus Nanopelagicales bacterium]
MGDADVRAAVGHVLEVLRESGRAECTVRRHQIVLDRFAVFLAGRGLDTASEGACIDFITDQTGVRLGSLRESVKDRDVQAVRRPVMLMAQALAGRTVEVDRSVIPPKDGCPARFGPLRDDYLAWCRERGNAGATMIAKDKAVSRFLGYLDEVGAGDLAALGVRDLSGFFVRQRGLRRKTIAAMRSSLRDFLAFSATAGKTPQGLADRLPRQRHVRHESEPHLWTAEEIRRVLAVIDRASATGKRDYAMILATARLGLRICDLRQLELGDLDWRAKQVRIVQQKTGRSLSLPLLDDVGWAIIDYVRGGRPETACRKVFVKHRHPFNAFGCSSSVASRLSRHAARAQIVFGSDEVCGMHSLRGALAVAMIGNGAPIPVVSAVLGHASSDTTQAYYLRFDVERLRRCALDVEDVLDLAGAGERGA